MKHSIIPSFASDRRGTSAIEFALIAPLLALMTMGISDLALGLTRKYKLEQASYRALELVTVGSLARNPNVPPPSDYTFLKTEAATAAGVPEGNVTVTPRLECNGTEQNFDMPCTNAADQIARFITVTIIDDYQPLFPYGPAGARFTGSADGKIRLTARSTIRMQ